MRLANNCQQGICQHDMEATYPLFFKGSLIIRRSKSLGSRYIMVHPIAPLIGVCPKTVQCGELNGVLPRLNEHN